MKLYECVFCGDVFDRTELNDFKEAGEEYWLDGEDFVCPDCLDHISRLSLDEQFSKDSRCTGRRTSRRVC